MVTFRVWARAPMYERCPGCGHELHRIRFQEHRGHHVPSGVAYWQECHNCTFMGSPTLYERVARDLAGC